MEVRKFALIYTRITNRVTVSNDDYLQSIIITLTSSISRELFAFSSITKQDKMEINFKTFVLHTIPLKVQRQCTVNIIWGW